MDLILPCDETLQQTRYATAYSSPTPEGQGRASIDRELYLPKSWTDDRARCRESRIDDEVTFAKKPELAQVMIEWEFDADIPFGWVTANETYGQVDQLRMWLESSRGVDERRTQPSNATRSSSDSVSSALGRPVHAIHRFYSYECNS